MCNIIIVLIVLTNFGIVTANRINRIIQIVIIQGILLGLLPVTMGIWRHNHILLIVCATIITKGYLIPYLFRHATRKLKLTKELTKYISFNMSLVLCALGTGFGLFLAKRFFLINYDDYHMMIVIASTSTFFSGFILLITRKKALMQVVGYLMLENSIYLFGLILTENMPLFIEMGILLDLFVGIFLMMIVIRHITATFNSIDTRYLTELKD